MLNHDGRGRPFKHDLVKRHAEIAEPADHLRYRNLTRLIDAVAGHRVDLGRLEQAHVVVMP
jgi:hypothetical protein